MYFLDSTVHRHGTLNGEHGIRPHGALIAHGFSRAAPLVPHLKPLGQLSNIYEKICCIDYTIIFHNCKKILN